jgi:hypothetical protein
MGNVIIHEFVQGHDAPNRPYGEIRRRKQAPDAKLAGIGMGLLQVIYLRLARLPRWVIFCVSLEVRYNLLTINGTLQPHGRDGGRALGAYAPLCPSR